MTIADVEFAFVTAPRQNHFFLELVSAIRDELDQLGVVSRHVVGDFPEEEDGLVYVLTPPHEWFSLHGSVHPPSPRQLRRTVLLCAEQPQTGYFLDNALIAPFAGAMFDISPMGIEEFHRYRIDDVRHFQLGWTRTWSDVEPADIATDDDGRDIDVLHLGIHSERRGHALAAGSHALSRLNSQLILGSRDGPGHRARENFAIDGVKMQLLRRSKVLLNLHQDTRPYFEWLRVVQAMSQGCAVVTEHSMATAPLVPGEHLLSASPQGAALVAAGLIEDDATRREIAAAGYDAVRNQFPLRKAVEEFAEAGAGLASKPDVPSSRAFPDLVSPPASEIDFDDAFRGPWVDPEASRDAAVRQTLKDLRLQLMDLGRDLQRDRVERLAGHAVPNVVIDVATPGWRAAAPGRVSVITALYNHAGHIEAALESVVDGTYTDIEFVIVDDGSTDESNAAVRRFMYRHADLPILLVRHPVNRGLGHARNSALSFARGEMAFVLDADNEVHRRGLDRLVYMLDTTPDATFSYGMLDMFNADGPVGLLSFFPWEPRRLRNGNYIDAMALWRRGPLNDLGRFTTDSRLYGWEDYDLWCRCAEQGVSGAFAPQMVARYRTTRHSMISTTNISTTVAMSVLCERYPELMSGIEPPP